MLKVLTSHQGKTKRLSIAEAVHSKSLAWIDAEDPTKQELHTISELFGISESDLDDVMDPQERSRVEDNRSYKLIILRAPVKVSEIVETTPIGVFITRNNILTIHKKRVNSIVDIHNNPEVLHHGVQHFVFRLIDKMLSSYFELVQKIDSEIEHVEERVLERADKSTAVKIFTLKKTLTFFQRSLLANRETVSQMIKLNVLHLSNKDVIILEDLHTDINQLIEMTDTHKEILTGALEIHASSVSNRLNEVVKRMTVIGSFVLIPTLIASIYGMNFGGPTGQSTWNMPELAWTFGYPFALALMALSCIMLFTAFKLKGWL